jgi:DNA replication protein DnaC
MNATDKIDAARIDLLLGELRLPGIKLIWTALAQTADKEGWPAARFLAALAEQEMVERSRRRFERHLEEARLPPGKTLDAFDFDAVPMISKAQVQALAAAMPGSKRAPISCVLARLAEANRIWRQRSAWL